MATYLFDDIANFQDYVGGAANISMEMRSLKPWIKKAFDNHIAIWLGPELWVALVDAVEAGSVDPASDIGKLLPLVCSPLAMLTMYEYSFIGGVQFGEAGIFRTETEEMKSPYKYQEANYRESMLNNGYEGIEEMQSFLDANAANYGTWSAKDRSRELLINYAADLRTAYSKYISRYTFEIIRSVIEDVELFALVPNIGQAQYDAIKSALLAGNLTDAQKALLKVLRKVVGNFAIKEGILRQWVLLDGRSVVQNLQRSIDARQQAITPESGSGALSITVTKADEFANRYIAYLEHFLTENIDDYPLYQEFIDAQAAAAAADAEAEIDERQGDHCCNSDYSSPDVSGRRGIVPLQYPVAVLSHANAQAYLSYMAQIVRITTTQAEIDQDRLAQESRAWLIATKKQLLFQLASLNLGQQAKVMSDLKEKTQKPLDKSVSYKFKKFRGNIDSLGFSFARHGIFLERGVGRGRPVNSSAAKAAAKPWLEPVLKPAIEDLANHLAEFYADEIANELRFLIPGIIDERIKL